MTPELCAWCPRNVMNAHAKIAQRKIIGHQETIVKREMKPICKRCREKQKRNPLHWYLKFEENK